MIMRWYCRAQKLWSLCLPAFPYCSHRMLQGIAACIPRSALSQVPWSVLEMRVYYCNAVTTVEGIVVIARTTQFLPRRFQA